MTATRRLAAILAADVVGYSLLMGEDEAGTAQAVRDHRAAARPIVAGLGGRIVKTTGDGLLLEFPSIVAAVECAIAIQRLMAERNVEAPEAKRIVYRIGVNLGDVLIDGDDILGDGVNIAARLEGICEPGGILISGAAYDHVRGRIDVKFVNIGEKTLKNIAQPVRVYALRSEVSGVGSRPTSRTRPGMRAALMGIVGLILVGAFGAWLLVANRPPAVATSPSAPAAAPDVAQHFSIVVLPFANLSGDPGQDYFADGITENLTTELSRIKDTFVIARSTAFTYKGRSVDAKEIAKELGVRYVLEGSVQRDGNRVRVNAQLVDAESGAHLWADRFEDDVADLFALQDRVVARLGNILGFELVKAEARKSVHSKNPDAIDLAMRGWATMWQSYPMPPKAKRDSHYAALDLFNQAIRADPNNAGALAGKAFTHMSLFVFGEAGAEADLDAEIIDPADRAIALAPDDMRAYVAKSFYMAVSGRAAEALRTADAGLAINPNSAPLLDAKALAEIVLGRFERAKSDAQHALQISPRDPEVPNRLVNMGMADLGRGIFDAAVIEFQKAIDSGDHSFIPYANLAAAYALAGQKEAANSALAEARGLNPNLTVKWLTDHAPRLPPLFDGLRKAGLPEE